jgi:hypothetical protein
LGLRVEKRLMAAARSSKRRSPRAARKRARRPGAETHPPEARTAAPFPIALGASAGGLEAFEIFFKRMPLDSGIGFVLVPHLDTRHKSAMAEPVQRHTLMPVDRLGWPYLRKPFEIDAVRFAVQENLLLRQQRQHMIRQSLQHFAKVSGELRETIEELRDLRLRVQETLARSHRLLGARTPN